MDFQEAVKGLRSEEIEALKVLEASGWQVGLDVRVEDMTKPDGQRRRTFSNRGRYAVAVFLKNLGGRDRVEFPAFTPDLNQGTKLEDVKTFVVDPYQVIAETIVEESGAIVSEAVIAPEVKVDPVPDEKPAKGKRAKGGRR